jgi:hypothetical protein
MVGHDQMGAVGDPQMSAGTSFGFQRFDFLEQDKGIDNDTGTDDAQRILMENA